MSSSPRSWNRIPHLDPEHVCRLTDRALPGPDVAPRPLLAHGSGRSYSDVCLSTKGTLLLTKGLDHFISFDSSSGILRCESGMTLEQILAVTVPRGWFLPVTPGTRFVTVGGAVANDVHGKNHHVAGTFGHHIRRLELLRSCGERIECGPDLNPEWFAATVGGLGLTGLISWVELQLMPIASSWMNVRSWRFSSLRDFCSLTEEAELTWPYVVAWVDGLASGGSRGRGVLFAGKHCNDKSPPVPGSPRTLTFPLAPRFSLVNRPTVALFNSMYFRRPISSQDKTSHYEPFFYPLDNIRHWNRLYGTSGFYQFQCVVPPQVAHDAVDALLESISRSGEASFLAVLKRFGSTTSVGQLSFARAGTTLALDFPNRGKKTLKLLAQLDTIVLQAGGALYPAKDARMSPDVFRASFPRWCDFRPYVDPGFSSSFWERVIS